MYIDLRNTPNILTILSTFALPSRHSDNTIHVCQPEIHSTGGEPLQASGCHSLISLAKGIHIKTWYIVHSGEIIDKGAAIKVSGLTNI